MTYIHLDDRIFRLQNTSLPEDLSALLHKADVAFLQDRDAEAERLVSEIERACRERGITIADPMAAIRGLIRGGD